MIVAIAMITVSLIVNHIHDHCSYNFVITVLLVIGCTVDLVVMVTASIVSALRRRCQNP